MFQYVLLKTLTYKNYKKCRGGMAPFRWGTFVRGTICMPVRVDTAFDECLLIFELFNNNMNFEFHVLYSSNKLAIT